MSGMCFGVTLKMDITRHVSKRVWTMCLTYDNHSRLND